MSLADKNESKGIIQMLCSVVLFTVNTLLIRWLALSFSAVDGWQTTLFRGIAGIILVLLLFTGGRGLRLKHLWSRSPVIARGVLGAASIYLFYFSIIHLGAGRAVVLNLT